jgi:hypothetical protein
MCRVYIAKFDEKTTKWRKTLAQEKSGAVGFRQPRIVRGVLLRQNSGFR